MAKNPHHMKGGDALPSREDILDFIRRTATPVGKREIAREFGLKGEAKVALKRRVAELDSALKRFSKAGTHAPAWVFIHL